MSRIESRHQFALGLGFLPLPLAALPIIGCSRRAGRTRGLGCFPLHDRGRFRAKKAMGKKSVVLLVGHRRNHCT